MIGQIEKALISKYPLFLTLNDEETEFEGFLKIKNFNYKISFNFPFAAFDNSDFRVFPALPDFEKKLEILRADPNVSDVVQLLDNLSKILIDSALEDISQRNTLYVQEVIREFIEVKRIFSKVRSCILTDDFCQVIIKHEDDSHRYHILTLKVSYEDDGYICELSEDSLPENTYLDLFNSIIVAYQRFSLEVELFCTFYNVMDEIDKHCWVVEPETPRSRDHWRRILLTKSCSLKIEVNIDYPHFLPMLIFLGTSDEVKEFHSKKTKNMKNWDSQGDFIKQLLNLLEMQKFLENPYTEKKKKLELVNDQECSICFAKNLENKSPDVVCPNSACNQYFHSHCLDQWFISVEMRKTLKSLERRCPSCQKPILFTPQ